jgi:sec-independent protein translocase protein TatB
MNVFGVGTGELVVLALLAGVILGPRRMVKLARELGRLVAQVRSLANEVSRQVNQEIALLDLDDTETAPRKPAASRPADELPEAYRRFREDFPEEGQLPTGAQEPQSALSAEAEPQAGVPAATEAGQPGAEAEVDANPAEAAAETGAPAPSKPPETTPAEKQLALAHARAMALGRLAGAGARPAASPARPAPPGGGPQA